MYTYILRCRDKKNKIKFPIMLLFAILFLLICAFTIFFENGYDMNVLEAKKTVYKVSILNLNTKKEVYSGIVRSNFRSNLNDFFVSDKINE